MDVQAARERLEQMLRDLDRSAETLRLENTDPGELSVVDQHPADIATNLADADRGEAAIEVVLGQREQVQDALERIEQGSYGRCVDCGAQLTDERLEARPEAARCVTCQQRSERAH